MTDRDEGHPDAGDEPPPGPKVTDTWVTSQRAVNAFKEFCLQHRWVFTETPEQTDFGKDGYLDFSHEDELTGQCIAVQIKGGSSWRTADGYLIRADTRRRSFWASSTVPVFGIVWDPDDGGLYWTDLTGRLREAGHEAELRVPASHRIDRGDVSDFLDAMWRSTTGSSLALAFGSDDLELQEAAIWDAYGMGRLEPRYLVLLRRVMFGLSPTALDLAISILNTCSLNGDNLYDPKWMSMETRNAIRDHLVWSVDEAIELLDRSQDEDGFERGSFSSCIYWLLVGPDPRADHFVDLAEEAALRAASRGREHAAKWALFLRVYWAGMDGKQVFERLCATEPSLGATPLAQEMANQLTEFGYLSI